jgi:hypothetical protein
MDRVASEMLPPLILDERRRQARREALLTAANDAGFVAWAVTRIGRALVRLGRRLERAGCPRSATAATALDLRGRGV